MGGWGLGFFQSDHDLDAIYGLDDAAGLTALEGKAKDRAKKRAGEAATGGKKSLPADEKPNLSVYAGHCDDIELVREHLDSGAMLKLIDHVKAKVDKANGYEAAYAKYELVLAGACAMSLGCKLPADFKSTLIKDYRSVGLMRDAIFQMQVALGEGSGAYQEGAPFDFRCNGLLKAANEGVSADSDRLYPGGGGGGIQMLNVSAPFGMIQKPEHRRAPNKQYPSDVCGGCGSKNRKDGKPLLVCGHCKTTKYCGRVCQQARFKQHKQVCQKEGEKEVK